MARIAAYMLIGFLAVAVPLMAMTLVRMELPKAEGFIRGKYTAALEEAISRQFAGRDSLIGIWGAVRYGLFSTGSRGVVVGSDGWLFTEEEFVEADPEVVAANLATLVELSNAVQAKGHRLVVMLLPAKARVLEAGLPPSRATIYADALAWLASAGIAVVGGLDALQGMQRAGAMPFPRTDTHWLPRGAIVVAELVLPQLDDTFGSDSYRFSWQNPEPFSGDLARFVPTGFFRPLVGLRPETITRFAAIEAGGKELFATQDIPVVLVGTSYSAPQNGNLEDALKISLQADVLNLANEGTGIFAPMRKFLNEFDHAAHRLVIWEVPERYLAVKEGE